MDTRNKLLMIILIVILTAFLLSLWAALIVSIVGLLVISHDYTGDNWKDILRKKEMIIMMVVTLIILFLVSLSYVNYHDEDLETFYKAEFSLCCVRYRDEGCKTDPSEFKCPFFGNPQLNITETLSQRAKNAGLPNDVESVKSFCECPGY